MVLIVRKDDGCCCAILHQRLSRLHLILRIGSSTKTPSSKQQGDEQPRRWETEHEENRTLDSTNS